MCMSVTFFKLILTFEYKSMIVNLNGTIWNANNISQTDIVRKRHVCVKKFFLLALVCSTAVDTIFDASSTILVMVPVDVGFLGG